MKQMAPPSPIHYCVGLHAHTTALPPISVSMRQTDKELEERKAVETVERKAMDAGMKPVQLSLIPTLPSIYSLSHL